MFVILTHSIE